MRNSGLIFSNPVTGWVLLITILLAWIKGVQYALLGSFVPLAISLLITVTLVAALRTVRHFRRVCKIWSMVLISWAMVRLLLTGVHHFVKPIPEGHVAAHFGAGGLLVSLLVLGAGILLWKNKPWV